MMYVSDVAHCDTMDCPRRDECYRAWLTEEGKRRGDEYRGHISPCWEKCEMFVHKNEMK